MKIVYEKLRSKVEEVRRRTASLALPEIEAIVALYGSIGSYDTGMTSIQCDSLRTVLLESLKNRPVVCELTVHDVITDMWGLSAVYCSQTFYLHVFPRDRDKAIGLTKGQRILVRGHITSIWGSPLRINVTEA